MACATASAVFTGTTATIGCVSSSRCHSRLHILARPSYRPSGARLQQLNRNNLAKAIYSGCWGPVGTCGPSTSSRGWTAGPNIQRSFDKWAEQASNNMWFPVDVEETAQQYTFVADVPGLGKKDIKVQVNKNRELSISGERQQRSKSASTSTTGAVDVNDAETDKQQQQQQKVHRKRQERRFGTFKRSWNLPEDADTSQIKASVEQGVLTLVIQRTQPVEPEVTNIPIS